MPLIALAQFIEPGEVLSMDRNNVGASSDGNGEAERLLGLVEQRRGVFALDVESAARRAAPPRHGHRDF